MRLLSRALLLGALQETAGGSDEPVRDKVSVLGGGEGEEGVPLQQEKLRVISRVLENST